MSRFTESGSQQLLSQSIRFDLIDQLPSSEESWACSFSYSNLWFTRLYEKMTRYKTAIYAEVLRRKCILYAIKTDHLSSALRKSLNQAL